MKTIIKTNWTKDELYAYIFIYCMNADYKETSEELNMITSRFGNKVYDKMHKEFEKDTDYTSIQKIKDTLEDYNYTDAEIRMLFNEIKDVFLLDGKYEILERNLFLGLKRLLN